MVITGVKLLLQIICNACPLRCNQKGFIYSIYQFWSCIGYLLLFLCWGHGRSLYLQKQHHLLPLISINKTKGSLAACSVLVIYCSTVAAWCVLAIPTNSRWFVSCIHIGLFNLWNHAKSGCVQHSTIYTKRKVMMCKELHKNILIMFFSPKAFYLQWYCPDRVFAQLWLAFAISF